MTEAADQHHQLAQYLRRAAAWRCVSAAETRYGLARSKQLVVLAIALHQIRPKPNVLDLIRPRSMVPPSELSLEIVG
jgi:hypothetical protein